MRRKPLVMAAICLVGMGLCNSAAAFVCARVPDAGGDPGRVSTAWFTRTIPRAYARNGTASLSTFRTFSTLDDSFNVWQNMTTRPGLSCSAPPTNLQFSPRTITDQRFVGYNFLAPEINENVLVFRDNDWSHDSVVIALTTTTYNALTGRIFDADIEFNSQQFEFSIGDASVQTDLMNTATHEIGHFLGFAHSLEETATMYAEAPLRDTQKRQLSCDDAAIMGFRYPAGTDQVGYCDPPNADCGFCGEPGVLRFLPRIVLRDANDGRGGSCTASPVGLWGALMAAGWCVWRRSGRLRR